MSAWFFGVRRFLREQDGSAFAILAFLISLFVGISGFAVDMSYFYALRSDLQATADAAALAGASQLPDSSAVKAEASGFAFKNMPKEQHGTILADKDIELGTWDAATRTFNPGGGDPDAVRVTLRRAKSNGNAAKTFFAQIFGVATVDVVVQAIGFRKEQECYLQGVMADGTVTFAQDTTIDSGHCVYGGTSVHFDQDSTVDPDTMVGSPDDDNITWDQGFSYDPDSLEEIEFDVSDMIDVANRIDRIESGDTPDQITSVQVITGTTVPDDLDSGTAYIFNGDIEIDKELDATDVLIAVRGNITIGKKGRLINSAGTCAGGETAIGVIATGDVHIGKESVTKGVQLIAGNDFQLDQLADFEGSIMAGGNVQIDQAPLFTDCKDAFDTQTIHGGYRLVG